MADRLPPNSCEWCSAPIDQTGVGRPRLYCRRTCRELAYRERRTVARVDQAMAAVSSTDETRPAGSVS